MYPNVVRIKRKRNTPLELQGLIFKKSKKNEDSHNDSVFFKFANTEEESYSALHKSSILAESKSNKKTFLLPQTVDEAVEPAVPDELSDMVQDYLNIDHATQLQPHKLKPPSAKTKAITTLNDEDDYVYDVYYRDKSVYDQKAETNVGYILFSEQDELVGDDDDDERVLSDDEDSNAESFYQNDYPEDEDAFAGEFGAGEFGDAVAELSSMDEKVSDDEDDEFEIAHNRRKFSVGEYMTSEGVVDEPEMFLDQEELDTAWDNYGDKTFKRNKFFEGDDDDPVAIYRDKIFGELEEMLGGSAV